MSRILKVSRLEGLTDGVFAIAMTILVLDLRLPVGITPEQLPDVLTSIVLAKLFIYVGSFILLGTLWVAMNFQLGLLERINRPYLWTNVFYLMVVCVVPFSASLVAAYPHNTSSILFYAFNLLCVSLMQFLILLCSHHYHLNNTIYTPALRRAIVQRIFVAPCFYLLSILCAYWDPSLSFILLLVPTAIYMLPGKVDKFEKNE